jgi:hypothetical protein
MTVMLRNIKWLFLILLITLLIQAPVIALPALGYQNESILGISIRNDGGRDLTFWLRNGKGEWEKAQLDIGSNKLYKDYDRIWVTTEGDLKVVYALEDGCRYRIFWNRGEGLWDVQKLILKDK